MQSDTVLAMRLATQVYAQELSHNVLCSERGRAIPRETKYLRCFGFTLKGPADTDFITVSPALFLFLMSFWYHRAEVLLVCWVSAIFSLPSSARFTFATRCFTVVITQ